MEIRRIREAHYRGDRPEPQTQPETTIEIAVSPEPPTDPAVIPDNWRDLPWSRPREPGGMTLRGLVKQLGGTAINAEQAFEVIESHLERTK